MKLFTDDLIALIDALHIQKTSVLGFSMGGNITQTFALKYPQRIEKLILAATYATMNQQVKLYLDTVLSSVYEEGATKKQMFDVVSRLSEFKASTLIISGEIDCLANLEDSTLPAEKVKN